MRNPIAVKTPQGEYTLDQLDNFMDLHGIIHVSDAIAMLNGENEKRNDPVRFIFVAPVNQEFNPEDIE